MFTETKFAKFLKIDSSEELKVGETRKKMNASDIFGIIATLIVSQFFFNSFTLFRASPIDRPVFESAIYLRVYIYNA